MRGSPSDPRQPGVWLTSYVDRKRMRQKRQQLRAAGLILGASLRSLRRQPRPVITLTPVITIDIDVPAVRRRRA